MGALLAELPALPLHEAGKYVAGAYIVLFVLVLIYVAIMAVRLSRIEREVASLLEAAGEPQDGVAPEDGAGPPQDRARPAQAAAQLDGQHAESTLA